MPHRPQPVRPLIARPRARCACNRSPEIAILSFQPSSTGSTSTPRISVDALGDLLGQRKAVGEIFEILRRRHHDGEGRAADDDLNRRFDGDRSRELRPARARNRRKRPGLERRSIPGPHSAASAKAFSIRRNETPSSRSRICQSEKWLVRRTCTAVTLYSGQLVAQSE